MSLEYAKRQKPDAIFILSAKHWLVELDDIISPYELTLNDMSSAERKTWAETVLRQLAKRADLHKDHFTLLAGQKYRQYLLPALRSAAIPLIHKPIGMQLQFLSTELSK